MSDLIERLRDDEANRWGNTFAIRHEAADEIERLTTENSKLKAALAESCDENRAHVLAEGPWSTDMCPIAGKLTAENSKLAAAAIEKPPYKADLLAEVSRLTVIADAGERLYRQCHNLKTATPRWANESVCFAMQDFGKALDTDSGIQTTGQRESSVGGRDRHLVNSTLPAPTSADSSQCHCGSKFNEYGLCPECDFADESGQ